MTTAPTVAAIRDRQRRLLRVLSAVQPHRIRPRSLGKRLRSLYQTVDLLAPELVTDTHHTAFRLISEQTWHRPLWTWDGSGGMRGLLMHLLVTVPWSLPDFLFTLPHSRDTWRLTRAHRAKVALLAHLGTGGTMRAARDRALIPASLTRRMHHRLLAVEGALTLGFAIRTVQLQTFGGSERLLEALQATRLAQLQDDTHHWQKVIAWLCAGQHRLPLDQLRPLVDWLFTRSPQERRQRIRQPLPAALRRAVEWHHTLHRPSAGSIQPGPLPASGIPGVKLEAPWSMTELRTGRALAAEGTAMRHCVATYWGSIMSRRSSIFSLRRDMLRRVTVEVRLSEGCVVQARGACNRRPDGMETAQIRAWAIAAGLRVRSL